ESCDVLRRSGARRANVGIMSSLFSSLTAAARALDAQRFGLDATGANIADVNTPGYTRRVIDMAAVPPESNRTAGRGVDVIAIRSARDLLIGRRPRWGK